MCIISTSAASQRPAIHYSTDCHRSQTSFKFTYSITLGCFLHLGHHITPVDDEQGNRSVMVGIIMDEFQIYDTEKCIKIIYSKSEKWTSMAHSDLIALIRWV